MNNTISFIKIYSFNILNFVRKIIHVKKANKSFMNTKNDINEHFADVSKMVEIGYEANELL